MEKILLAGHYCHDSLHLPDGSRTETLGGSVSYISSIFHALGLPSHVTSKVGDDFAYFENIFHTPKIIPNKRTTHFISDLTHGPRTERVDAVCDPIYPQDLPTDQRFEIALAVGIIGEVLPETLQEMKLISKTLLCDVQGLLRFIDPRSNPPNKVCHNRLHDTEFEPFLDQIAYLKASRIEASSFDIEQMRKRTCLLITEGKDGCVVYETDREYRVPSFPANEVDPTGAGDCFLAGFAFGLHQGLPLEKAVRLGNYFGSLAVQQVGVPKLPKLHELSKIHELNEPYELSSPSNLEANRVAKVDAEIDEPLYL